MTQIEFREIEIDLMNKLREDIRVALVRYAELAAMEAIQEKHISGAICCTLAEALAMFCKNRGMSLENVILGITEEYRDARVIPKCQRP